MKKLLFLLVVIMSSCTLSNEKKAEILIKETLKEYLYHPDSYEPIATKVDSIFIDINMIEPIMESSDKIDDLISKIDNCNSKIDRAESSMDIWAPHGYYSSQFERGQYARAKKERDEAKSDLDKYNKKLYAQLAILKENVAKIRVEEFTGWAVAHRFRSLNGAGSNTLIGEWVFFCDQKFTTCQGFELSKLEKYANVSEVVREATCDEDIIDYFKDNNSSFYDSIL